MMMMTMIIATARLSVAFLVGLIGDWVWFLLFQFGFGVLA